MAENYFHLRCRISRKGSDYGLNKETFTSGLHMVLAKADSECLFIGSSPKSQIHIKGIEAAHATLMLSNEQITVEALSPFDLVTKKEKKQIQTGERVRLPLGNRAKWDIVFPNQTAVRCTIYDEVSLVPQELRERLEVQYGKLEKIWESQTFYTFKTENDKVLKVLQPTYTKNRQIANRFEKAAKSFQKLPADLFVKINKVINDAKTQLCYVEMDYVESEILGNYAAKKGLLPREEAEYLIKEAAQRLTLLQDQGFSVRNIHPYNMLLGKDNTLRIIGFFLLKDYSLHMTQASDQMVIPNYTSPEQLQNPSLVDIYSDVYSLGVIFYSLLLGEPPIGGNNIPEYVALLSEAEPITVKHIQKTAPDVPDHTAKLIAAMLSFDKGQRPAPRQVVSILAGQAQSPEPPAVAKKPERGLWQRLMNIFRLPE